MNDPFLVLLVEDDSFVGGLIEELVPRVKSYSSVQRMFLCERVDSVSEALHLLSKKQIDIILLDLNLPDSSGLETLKTICAAASTIPVVVVSGHINEEMEMAVMRDGAQDCLTKDQLNMNNLGRSMRYAMERQRLLLELKASEERLRLAQRMESVGRLAGGVAHDFNNILTAITGYSDILLTDFSVDDPKRVDVKEIQKAGKRAASLTRQLLAFSRKQVLKPRVISLNSVVVEIENMLRRLIGEDIKLLSNLAADAGNVRADPGQLEQVLVNLVVNARDAMTHGGVLVIETACIELDEEYAAQNERVRPGTYAVLSVSDNGIGMDEETKSRIFDPFFTTKEKGQGTGLGLATAYGIVKQGGGNISVKSKPNKGSTFKIYLPQAEGKVEELESIQISNKPLQGSETILLVEDDEIVRTLVQNILKRYGYDVLVALSPEEAQVICKHHEGPIHMILTDVVMPTMGGREVAQQVVPMRPNIKVLYMSGYSDEAIVRQGKMDPGSAFIQKPFSPDNLALKIRESLDGFMKSDMGTPNETENS